MFRNRTLHNYLLLLVKHAWTNIHNQLPKDVKDRMAQGTRSVMYDENSKNLPDMLIDLAISSSLIVIVDETLFAIYANSDDFKKARSDWVKNVEKLELLFALQLPTKMFISSNIPTSTEPLLLLSLNLLKRLN